MKPAQDHVLGDVVAAFVRSLRAMGYYDESHPVFEASRREAHEALQQAFRTEPIVTLGGGGHHLLVDAEGTALNSVPAVAFARRLFDHAIVAIRFRPDLRPEDVGALMAVLAEREDRVREAGGANAVLGARGIVGIDILEVDIDALFAGRQSELGSVVDGDPVAELALKAMLRFREAGAGEEANALQISLEQVGSAGSLGGFLDELLDQAEPGVLADGQGGGPLSGDDLADLASQAFLRSHGTLSRSDPSGPELAQSAELLSNALVRLSPEARFALLRKLAGADEIDDHRQAAVRDLGARVDDGAVTAAIAAALFDQHGDPATARSIGNLIRRIRPIEADRHRLLSAVDDDLQRIGRPIDGVLWQEMQSRALDDASLGMLEMRVNETRATLEQYARARRGGRLAAVAGQDVLHTVDPKVVEYWTTEVLTDLLADGGRLGGGAVDACRLQLELLDQAGAGDECMQLLMAMVHRTEARDEEELTPVLLQLLDGPSGPKWTARLLKQAGPQSRIMGEILLSALDRPGGRAQKEQLIGRLARFDRDTLLRLVNRFGPRATPLQAQSLVVASLRCDLSLGVKAARMLLRNPTSRVREVVIKAVVERPNREVIALLAHVAGWKGDRYTKSLLALDGTEPRSFVHRMQLTAIGALGMSRSALAARPLFDILVRTRMFSDREQEEQRVAAAQALRTNATPEAQSMLREASRHRKRAIRDVVLRVLGRGGVQ